MSSSSENAKDRITDATFTLLDGTIVATSIADLTDGSLQNPIDMSQNGTSTGGNPATGTKADGTAHSATCNNWTTTSSGVDVMTGAAYATGVEWTENYTAMTAGWGGCNITWFKMYCFEQ